MRWRFVVEERVVEHDHSHDLGRCVRQTASSAACVLTPEVTEGPYYLDLNKVRSDITEGKDGAPLDLKITVVDATGCTPIKDAAVDVWHCDAGGVYSGFSQASAGGPGGRAASRRPTTRPSCGARR